MHVRDCYLSRILHVTDLYTCQMQSDILPTLRIKAATKLANLRARAAAAGMDGMAEIMGKEIFTNVGERRGRERERVSHFFSADFLICSKQGKVCYSPRWQPQTADLMFDDSVWMTSSRKKSRVIGEIGGRLR